LWRSVPYANLANPKAAGTVAISNEAKRRKAAGEDVLDLGVGEPDFDTPAAVAKAAIAAIEAGKTRYPPNVGIPELRRAMAGSLSAMSNGRPVDPERVIVSNGSKQSLFNACFTLFGAGDEVLIPSPAWVSYPQIVHLCRATPVMVAGDPEWGLKVAVAETGADVSVVDRTGGGDHFQVTVLSSAFDGLSLVDQHRLVNRALATPLADGTIHELRITTKGSR